MKQEHLELTIKKIRNVSETLRVHTCDQEELMKLHKELVELSTVFNIAARRTQSNELDRRKKTASRRPVSGT